MIFFIDIPKTLKSTTLKLKIFDYCQKDNHKIIFIYNNYVLIFLKRQEKLILVFNSSCVLANF